VCVCVCVCQCTLLKDASTFTCISS